MYEPDGQTPLGAAQRPFVMLVEDDVAQATMYQLGLQAAGFRVAVFSDASALFEALEMEVPDIAVLDWRFTGTLTGVDIIENMRLDKRLVGLPILMLSNHNGQVDGAAHRALEAGAIEWLIKARTTPRQLAARLRLAVGAESVQLLGREAGS